MKKKNIYFIVSISFIIAGLLIWACKYNLGPGNLDLSVINKGGGLADNLIGYNGSITYSGSIQPNMDNATQVFPSQKGSAYYRIPSLVVTTNGTLLAFADKRYNSKNDLPNRIEVEVKRSTNNGKTWSNPIRITPTSTANNNGYGDTATVLVRQNNTVLAFVVSHEGFLQSTSSKPQRINLFRSSDEGLTWQGPEDITSQIYGSQCSDTTRKNWHAAFVSSGNGIQLSTGRILFVLNVRENNSTAVTTFKNYCLYSDDGGYTWSVSKNAPVNSRGGNEAKIVELVDGRLLMSARPSTGNKRMHAYSSDQGETWDSAKDSDITAAGSNGDMIYYTSVKNGWDTNRIIHFIPTSTTTVSGDEQYNGRTGPANPKFYYSYDDGKTFQKTSVIRNKQSGYSSLAVLHDGSIGVLFEDKSWGGPIKFMRVSFQWLTKNKDKGPKKNNNSGS